MTENKIEFEIDPSVAQGHYSNFVIIAHSPSEVILDFASMLPSSQSQMLLLQLKTATEPESYFP